MNFIIVGTNHKYSPIQIRESLSFSKKRLNEALKRLAEFGGINAGVILSTCNRVELYSDALDPDLGTEALKKFLSDYQRQELFKIEPYLYAYTGKEAVMHLFKVTSGIDSQILGENQILEQVSSAFKEAKEAGTTNDILSRIFSSAIDTAIKVKKKTEISKGDITIASIVVDFIKEKFIELRDKKILIIGVGKISELMIKDLKKEKIKVLFIANRTYERARQLAESIGAGVARLDRLKEELLNAEIVISATASPHLILKKVDLVNIRRPLLIIDLAVPRNVEPEVRHIDGISLFCLDDLDFIVEKKLDRRRQEIPKASKIIEEGVESLWLSGRLGLEPEPALLP